jgi:hypothetical protein
MNKAAPTEKPNSDGHSMIPDVPEKPASGGSSNWGFASLVAGFGLGYAFFSRFTQTPTLSG